MEYEQLKQLIDQIDHSTLREFDMSTDTLHVRMSKNKQQTSVKETTPAGLPEREDSGFSVETSGGFASSESHSSDGDNVQNESQDEKKFEGHLIKSPIVGVVYLSPAPGEPVFKEKGDTVSKGDTLCIVEAMKVMNEIKSDAAGTVIRPLVEDGQAVEYNQPLFEIKTED